MQEQSKEYPEVVRLRGAFLDSAARIEGQLGDTLVTLDPAREAKFRKMTLGGLLTAFKESDLQTDDATLVTDLDALVSIRNVLAHGALVTDRNAASGVWTFTKWTRDGDYEPRAFTIEELRTQVESAKSLEPRVWELWERVAG